jgi:hypothetical protein
MRATQLFNPEELAYMQVLINAIFHAFFFVWVTVRISSIYERYSCLSNEGELFSESFPNSTLAIFVIIH